MVNFFICNTLTKYILLNLLFSFYLLLFFCQNNTHVTSDFNYKFPLLFVSFFFLSVPEKNTTKSISLINKYKPKTKSIHQLRDLYSRKMQPTKILYFQSDPIFWYFKNKLTTWFMCIRMALGVLYFLHGLLFFFMWMFYFPSVYCNCFFMQCVLGFLLSLIGFYWPIVIVWSARVLLILSLSQSQCSKVCYRTCETNINSPIENLENVWRSNGTVTTT